MKWRRTKSRDVIDVRGAGRRSRSGGFGGLGGGRIGIPRVGGGLGLIVVLVIVAIQVFGGGGGGSGFDIDQAFPQMQAPGADNPQPIPASEDPQRDLRDFSVYVFEDTQRTWARTFGEEGEPYENAKLVLYSGAVNTGGCGGATSAVGPLLLPGRRARLPRPQLLPGDEARAGRPRGLRLGLRDRSRDGPSRPAGAGDEPGGLPAAQLAPRRGKRPLGAPRAAGRLLRGGLGEHRLRAGRPRARRPGRGPERRRGGRRRPPAAPGRRRRQPRLLHARHLRAAPALVHDRLSAAAIREPATPSRPRPPDPAPTGSRAGCAARRSG